jgi:hypothetical protein
MLKTPLIGESSRRASPAAKSVERFPRSNGANALCIANRCKEGRMQFLHIRGWQSASTLQRACSDSAHELLLQEKI